MFLDYLKLLVMDYKNSHSESVDALPINYNEDDGEYEGDEYYDDDREELEDDDNDNYNTEISDD